MNRLEPNTVVLLGIPFHDVTMEETLAEIDRIIAEKTPRYIATANLDFAAQASRDVELQRILMDAHLVLCDGTPLIWASRLLKAPLRERVAGSDLTLRLMAHAAARRYRVFFLGSDERILTTARQKLEREHPGLTVCGIYAPHYAKLLDLDNDVIAARVKEARPDILLVALGAPKQEKWIYMNQRELGVPCSIGIGASLDFVAGKFSRAPVWMQKSGLEWLFRLMQEPRRLFSRYVDDLTFFISAFLKQKRELREPARPPAPTPSAPYVVDFAHYQWIGRADAAAVRSNTLEIPGPTDQHSLAVLDLNNVSFMDSIGLGLIMKGFKLCKLAGGGLILLRPSDPVRRLIETLKLDRLIPVAASMEEARALSRSLQRGSAPAFDADPAARRLIFRCFGDLTGTSASELFDMVLLKWSAFEWARFMEVDLRGVHFIDSSGLDSLLRARSLAQSRRGGRFNVTGANDNIRNVLAVARLTVPLAINIEAA
jgi:N-acetylglucosaminyldiphosphoundecaprenol N-acetyl-beta-D-mannosaminyltransferase